MKTCFKCLQDKPLEEFYRHPQMADGHLNKCKTCTKIDVALRTVYKADAVRDYEQKRSRTPERKAKQAEYQRNRRSRNPLHERARSIVGGALRSGRLVRGPCAICKSTQNIHAHHTDYSKPLDVTWLCGEHHREEHAREARGLEPMSA